MIHITCNMGSCDLPDMYALSCKSLVPMLQLLHGVATMMISWNDVNVEFHLIYRTVCHF